jgi:signal transduction histidine kinase
MARALRRITLDPVPGFRDRDLYVFVLDRTGTNAASAANPRAVGTNAYWARDASGKLFVQEFLARASPRGTWVDYRIPDPLTGAVMAKSSWIVLHDNLIFGCGIYLGELGI